MKKFILLPFLALLLIVSCSKSAKLNKSLDGTWTLKAINGRNTFIGYTIGTNYNQVFTMTKDLKDNGTYSVSVSITPTQGQTQTQTEKGAYSLVEDRELITKPNNVYTADTFTIVAYDKSTLKIKIDTFTYEYSKN